MEFQGDRDLHQVLEHKVLEHEGYSVGAISVADDLATANHLRELHKKRLYRSGYEGYSDRIDDEFHFTGTYFYATFQNEVVATFRLNDRKQSARFPFEMGRKPDGSQYRLASSFPSFDVNTYSLTPRHYRKATLLLMAAAGKHMHRAGAKRAFALVDVENVTTQRIHSAYGFLPSKEYPEPILFDTFLHRETKRPVLWQVTECDERAIARHSETYDSIAAGGESYAIARTP